jgi:putative membrane protein
VTPSDLPTLNAILNSITAVLLVIGFVLIKQKKIQAHKKVMLSALTTSLLFLTSYLIYHFNVGSVPYPHHNWTRPLYFAILIPHTVLATIMTPFIVIAVWCALKEKYEKHKEIVRWVWPVWIFVSLTGVIVYFMLYQL